MTIADVLPLLFPFAVAFAVLGMVHGLTTGAHPVRAAVSGLLAYAVLCGLIALPIVAVVAFHEFREVFA
jgi:hypothetical protein